MVNILGLRFKFFTIMGCKTWKKLKTTGLKKYEITHPVAKAPNPLSGELIAQCLAYQREGDKNDKNMQVHGFFIQLTLLECPP